mmetsp:Transcript_13419/g.37768  ORF Transcript_13419/g.37768 Transcript_13419/m.37768 type:complete len:388 (-) Transcript_13419:7-1170(-)
MTLVTKVAPTVNVGGGRKSEQCRSALFVAHPGLCAVHRPLAKENDIPRLGRGLDHKVLVFFSVHHAPRHLEIGLVRARHDAKAAVPGVVVPQNDVAAQQRGRDGSVVAVVGQKGVVGTRGAIDGPPVELESLRSLVLRQDHGQVVHPVSLAEESVKDGDQAGVRQDRLEDPRVCLSPLQATAEIHPTGSLAVILGSLPGVPEIAVGAFHHFVGVSVDGGVGLRYFLRREDSPHDQVSVQVKEVSLVLGHFDGIFHFLEGSSGSGRSVCRVVVVVGGGGVHGWIVARGQRRLETGRGTLGRARDSKKCVCSCGSTAQFQYTSHVVSAEGCKGKSSCTRCAELAARKAQHPTQQNGDLPSNRRCVRWWHSGSRSGVTGSLVVDVSCLAD